ncbi:MAG: sugar ABC transporter permease [bacterium]|nr:sugar ABC transporter permease [Candidatus Sumerlaeota bacterium]
MKPATRYSTTHREWAAGFAFASPWIIGFLLFTVAPICMSFYYSFCRYDVLRPPMFIGIENYRFLLMESEKFWKSVYNTVYFTVCRVPLVIAGSLLLALLLARPRRGIGLARTIFYMPSIISGVALSLIWLWLYNPKYGLVNQGLALLGVKGPMWLNSPAWSKEAIIFMGLWSIGGGRMIVMIAGLNAIPQHLYESASIDGAGWWSQFRHITLPQLSSTLFLLTIVEVIGSFQVFTEAYLMTSGGPLDSTLFYNLELYYKAFQEYNMGLASAMAWLLFVGTLIVTVFMFHVLGRRVYYEAEQ